MRRQRGSTKRDDACVCPPLADPVLADATASSSRNSQGSRAPIARKHFQLTIRKLFQHREHTAPNLLRLTTRRIDIRSSVGMPDRLLADFRGRPTPSRIASSVQASVSATGSRDTVEAMSCWRSFSIAANVRSAVPLGGTRRSRCLRHLPCQHGQRAHNNSD